MKRTLLAAGLALREAFSKPALQRTPEPTPDMSDPENVRAFHSQGAEKGALLGVYRYNASAVHALSPRGGCLVDLGCGSGQFLKYLALRRPDLRLLGIDLSQEMIAMGKAMLRDEGLAERVELRVGDMTAFAHQLPSRVDVVTSIFSLHHLPSREHLCACLSQIGQARRRLGSGFWIFDHARPRRRRSAERFPEIFTPDASAAFKADSTNSLIASWSFAELRQAVGEAVGGSFQSALPRVLPLYQVHWARAAVSAEAAPWQEPGPVERTTLADARALARLLGTGG